MQPMGEINQLQNEVLDKDGESLELGDIVTVFHEGFEPDEAEIRAIAKNGRVKIHYLNTWSTPGTFWINPNCLELARRGG